MCWIVEKDTNMSQYLNQQELVPGSLIDWLIMMGWDWRLRTAKTNGPIFHPPRDYEWNAVVMMMQAEDNFWLVYQSSLAVLPAETSGPSRRNGRRSENFAYSVSLIRQHAIKSYDMGPPALLHIRRKVCCGFLSLLKIHRLSRVWTRDPWVQWQAH
jgi:hypothetical protein